jgi:acetyl-CoA carboxylase biotin carboxyl carrier protein
MIAVLEASVAPGTRPGGRRGTRAQPDRTVAKDALTYEDLLKIVELVKSSPQFSEFRLKVGEIEVQLKRKREPGAAGTQESATESPTSPASDAAARADARGSDGVRSWPEHWIVVRSPMVGTFYRAPVPGERPFVEVGQVVEAEATVCIIEVMKLMNSIPATVRGAVREILVADAQAVQYGQPLIVLEPQ